jgi:AP-2 complex subunit alpha
MIRLTVRATDESVPPVLLKLMVDKLSAGNSTMAEKHAAPTALEISEAFGNVMVK